MGNRFNRNRLNRISRHSPQDVPEIEVELVGSRDEIVNRHMYREVQDGGNRHRLEPVSGYTPPEEPHQVNRITNGGNHGNK